MKILRTDPDRFGIRARLLTLLIPGILGLLAVDSWNDYHALRGLVQDAYDRSLLESVHALQGGMVVGPDGTLRLNAPPYVVQAMREDASREHRVLHVGLTPREPSALAGTPTSPPHQMAGAMAVPPTEKTLLGEPDLPRPPGSVAEMLQMQQLAEVAQAAKVAKLKPVTAAQQAASVLAASPALTPAIWYDAFYNGRPVRIVALQSQLVDGLGQSFDLLVQAAEGTGPRNLAQAASSEQALFRDARMVLVVVLLVWLGVTWSLQPLERLRKSVLQNKGRDLEPMDTSGVPHEVAPLVAAVNQHVASYRDLLDQQSQFLADASHQLRTPLAIMLTQAGVALREKDPAQIHDTLRAIVTQITRSRRLCEQLLSLAHASESASSGAQSSPADTPEVADLYTVARDVVLQYLTLAHEKNQDLGWMDIEPAGAGDGPAAQAPHIQVQARGPELHEVLANLVHNAIVYTPPGGRITVLVKTVGNMALAEVRDDGPGIAKARRREVFERFRQVNAEAQNSGPRGAGLGLAIARAYARRNGGDIELADAEVAADTEAGGAATRHTGLRAILRLPLAPGPRA
ncbi:MAG: histidine kinase [Rhodoferax sp.]|nr:histidine kinase [Rhodoferax sp.]